MSGAGQIRPKRPSYRSRLILTPFLELPRQHLIWVEIVGDAAARRVVQSQAMLPISVWSTALGWLVTIGGVVYELALNNPQAAAAWVPVGPIINVLAVVSAPVLSRAFARSAARTLIPAVQPLDATATVDNLTRILSRKPGYFVALARKHPGKFPPSG